MPEKCPIRRGADVGIVNNRLLDATGKRYLDSSGRNLIYASGACNCCGGGGNPCVNAPSAIAILDYTDRYFSPCTDCMAALPADCPWDGTFQYFDPGSCTFANSQCFNGYNGCYACHFNGVRMWEFPPPGTSYVSYNANTGAFYMQIVCQNGQNSGEIVWAGSRASADSFSGIYTRTGGCDQRTTVEIA